tara:strand:+ start:7430 stop:7861 length:432 start_codon:yes stop_codon:yes gene_type:complete
MKQYILAILILPFIFSCGSCEITDDNYTDLIDMENPPVITFDKAEYNFGTIIEGAVVTYRFSFTNKGSSPLLIASVATSCGCTVSENWSRKPIMPGEKGYIDSEFKSEGFPGTTDKKLTIVANTFPTNTIIKLKGTVIGPNQQ